MTIVNTGNGATIFSSPRRPSTREQVDERTPPWSEIACGFKLAACRAAKRFLGHPCFFFDRSGAILIGKYGGGLAVSLTVRGGGTGTNGQSLSDGVVVDCSRHMNRILSIDPIRRVAVVEAGVVKDQLNKALEPYGLFFAPELSTSNWATIGGMTNTDACGQGSCVYGKTSNHVRGLRAILMDGSEWWSRPVDADHLRELQARQDRIGEIYRLLDRVEHEDRDLIEETFPKLNRYFTGYDLAHLRVEQGRLNANSVLCGEEGTLAMIAEAELNLLPIPTCAALISIRYDNFDAALKDARALVALRVASVKTVDEKVLRLAKGDIVWPRIARFFPDDQDVAASGINIVEVLADDADVLADKVRDITAALERNPAPGRKGFVIADSNPDIDAIWTMRKRAVGLLGNVQAPRRPVAFARQGAGVYVTEKDIRSAMQILELRLGVELQSVALAAARRTPEALADFDFHLAIARATRNPHSAVPGGGDGRDQFRSGAQAQAVIARPANLSQKDQRGACFHPCGDHAG